MLVDMAFMTIFEISKVLYGGSRFCDQYSLNIFFTLAYIDFIYYAVWQAYLVKDSYMNNKVDFSLKITVLDWTRYDYALRFLYKYTYMAFCLQLERTQENVQIEVLKY